MNSNLYKNTKEAMLVSLRKDSIYEPAREVVEKAMRGEDFEDSGTPTQEWAGLVVQDLLRKRPPPVVWRGAQAGLARIGTILPFGMLDGMVKKMRGGDVVERMVRK